MRQWLLCSAFLIPVSGICGPDQPTPGPKAPLERYFGDAWHLVPERGPNYDVRIRFERKVANNVAEVVWHRTQHTDWNEDGTLNFQVRVKGLNEMSWWIMGYGDQAQVLAPQKLRDIVASRARNPTGQYHFV